MPLRFSFRSSLRKVTVLSITDTTRAFLRGRLNDKQRHMAKTLLSRFSQKDLATVAKIFGSSKLLHPYYLPRYESHFRALRHKKLNVLEIGIGGYENPKAGGESLRMWKAYFPNGNIWGIDIFDKSFHDEKRIKTFKGSQVDERFLDEVVRTIGTIDIIIDDGSHMNEHVIQTFRTLFPRLAQNGIYVIEDIQTSYWTEVRGTTWDGSTDLTAPFTSMNFFKSLTDGINHAEFTLEDYEPTYFDKNIVGMHFYHNQVFVYKGLNNDGSNTIRKNAPTRAAEAVGVRSAGDIGETMKSR